ncbi:PAP2 superfamily protein [Arcticibacter tournemirensis]|uniref:Inositol phosphorylceramide synthase n=1 Tax=Arcticibacter tournemirensis TaxID=699437 RepID=A0A5M9HJ89_9SPHI|nr:phosphatase PAP2 family protein [Arcticibacter tournemirensis]KAA8486770.1 inositol phosphorylceramide synthase [Arcticibacter tournemirensis]TQM49313.1 PAP2 superfamily protein [Arcticibacter tournemirensis]
MPASTETEHIPLINKNLISVTVISAAYLLLSYFLIGYKPEQLVLVILFNTLYYLSKDTRRLILGFSIFIIYWIIFDYMKAFPNYRYHAVDISGIYFFEKGLFGIDYNGSVLTPNEFFKLRANSAFDVLSGIFYLTWVPVPLLFAVYLFFKKRLYFFYFSLTFLLVNLLGFVIYYVHPAAPPWYVQNYGFQFNAFTPGNTAGLARFDSFFGLSIFKSIYAKSSNVFAAMPSLHSSYPVIVLFYGLRSKLRYTNILFGVIMLGIWFAAVYSSHHYIVDVLAGILCAICSIGLFQLLLKYRWMNSFINHLMKITSA